MKRFKRLATQDDCAPDAMRFFRIEFLNITGITIDEFKDRARLDDEVEWASDAIAWRDGDYVLSITPDDPYYKLDVLIRS